MSPYWKADFFGFFVTLFQRFGGWITGSFPSEIASDELQILILSLVAFSCSLVGAFLVLRKMTMLANSLSHTLLLGIVIAFFLFSRSMDGTMDLKIFTIASLLTAAMTTFLTQWLTRGLKISEDASIGLIFSTLFALGITFVTLFTKNAHIGTEIVMGNVDVLQPEDLKINFFLALFNLSLFTLFFRKYLITTLDPSFSKSLGVSSSVFHYLLMLQTAATAIGAFRAVGVILVLAFLVAPYLTARFFSDRLSTLLVLSPLIGISSSVIGVALSRHFLTVYQTPLSTGGIVVCVLLFFFFLAFFFAPKKGLLAEWIYLRYRKSQIRKTHLLDIENKIS